MFRSLKTIILFDLVTDNVETAAMGIGLATNDVPKLRSRKNTNQMKSAACKVGN